MTSTSISAASGSNGKRNLLKAFINGKHVLPSTDADTLPPLIKLHSALNPHQILSHYHPSDSTQIQQAIQSSKESQKLWSQNYSPLERGSILWKCRDLVQEHREELATLETLDTGRTITETRDDVDAVVDCLQFFAGTIPSSLQGSMVNLPNQNWAYTKREALGVTVGIGSWNFPLLTTVWKSAPALASGNSMVFKPSEYTPSTALKLAEIYKDAGLPDGLFNVVLGDGKEVGNELIQHPSVKKISFTGSQIIGKHVNEVAARDLKKVTLELGGKSPLIIFNDADIEQAVSGAMLANWYASGQVCSNGTRVFVHEHILPQFLEQLVERTKRLKIGDPLDPTTHVGPMCHANHLKKVRDYIQIGMDEGATLYYPKQNNNNSFTPINLSSSCENGLFLSPVIFTDCTDNMRIVKEEIFGMVMTVMTFNDEEEVIKRANDSNMGLAAGLFTKDLKRAHRVIGQLEAGTTWINNYNLAPAELPWGGYKASGIGRENSIAAIEEWTQLKSVFVEMNPLPDPYPKV